MTDERLVAKPIARAGLVVLSALGAAGCASLYVEAPDRLAAELGALPAATREAPPGGLPPIGAAEASAMAIAASVDLRAEREAIELREGAWRLGLRAYLPRLDLVAGNDERLSRRGLDSFTKTLSLSLEQPLWDGGRLAAARALESAELALARAELERKERDVGEAAVAAYRAVVAAKARLEIRRSSLESASAQREALRAEVELGLARLSDLLEADMSVSGIEIEISEAELAVAAARDELAEALGGYAPELTESLRLNAEAIGLDADRLRAASVERSPELSAARYGVLKKRAEAKAAAFAWLPSVGIKAGAQLSGEAFPLNRATWSVGLSAEFSSPFLSGALGASVGAEPPLDTTARSSARIQPLGDPARALGLKGSLAALRLEEERYASLVAKVERSADAAVLGYRSALRKRDIGAQALSIAESRSSLVALKVELGQATRFEAVEAELHRAGEEIGLVEAAHALLAAERRLERLLDLPPDCLAAFMEAL